jgi:hypothetical protein
MAEANTPLAPNDLFIKAAIALGSPFLANSTVLDDAIACLSLINLRV